MARTVSCWHLVLSWMAISNSSRIHNTRICMCSTQHPTNEVAGKLYSMKCDLTYTVCSSRCLIRELYNGLREDPEFTLYGFLVLMYTHTFLILLSLQAWSVHHSYWPLMSNMGFFQFQSFLLWWMETEEASCWQPNMFGASYESNFLEP